MARQDKTHNRPQPTKLGKLIEALEKIQILLARQDFEGIWITAERAIQIGTNRH